MRLIEKRISLLKQNVDTTNTVKDNKAAAKLLRSHLKEKNMETTFKMFDVATLVETLCICFRSYKKERSLQSRNFNKHKTCLQKIFTELHVYVKNNI